MQNFWDTFEGAYQMGVQPHRTYMLETLADHGVESLLDVGCGTGPIYELNRDLGYNFKYKGTDYAEGMIRVCKELFPDGDFEKQDMRKLTEPDNSWDCVLLLHALDHTDDYKAAIKEAARVAKRYVCIVLWRGFVDEGTNISTEQTYGLPEGLDQWPEKNHLQEYSMKVLTDAFAEAGLEVEETAEGEQLNGDYSHYNFLFLLHKT